MDSLLVMQAALKGQLIRPDDYLAGEELAEVKHEYFGGVVYAMAGATREHNQIAGNIYAAIHSKLRGGPCKVFISDVKVRLEALGDDVFYYPDVVVGCDPRDTHRLYLRYPKILIEVSSESTERLDRREKRWAYQTIETLDEYLLVSQDRYEVTAFRRVNNWNAEVLDRKEQILDFKSLEIKLPLSSIYEGVPIGR